MWLGTTGFIFFEGEGLLFFSLGVWIQKSGFNIDRPARSLNPLYWGIAFVVLAAAKTLLAFLGQPLLGNAVYPVLAIMHKCVVLSGLIAAWYGCNGLVSWCMQRKWFTRLTAFAFIIYVFHAPMVAYTIDAAFRLTGYITGYRMFCFILVPLAIICLAVLTGALLRKLVPGLYGILTGGRGL